MSKLAQSASKYTIHADFRAKGIVEKSDVIGAIFGQTEGLLGVDMDLRELQRTGRVGRILVKTKTQEGKSMGKIEIPSSLDASETALIAAALETIERVGPCDAEVQTTKVEDVRSTKRKYMIERAKEILTHMIDEGMPDANEISEQIKEAVRASEVVEYMGLPAGPAVGSNDSIVVVEGRADVVNLLKNGIKNAIAVEGTSIPQAVVDLSKQKNVTLFTDGDRGGELITRELVHRGCEIDFVARAPEGKEVEELTKKEIHKALRERVAFTQDKSVTMDDIQQEHVHQEREQHFHQEREQRVHVEQREQPQEQPMEAEVEVIESENQQEPVVQQDPQPQKEEKKIFDEKVETLKKTLDEIVGTRAAYLFDNDLAVLGKVPVKEMFSAVKGVKEAKALVFDGSVDQKLIGFAMDNGIKYVLGMKMESNTRVPRSLVVFTQE